MKHPFRIGLLIALLALPALACGLFDDVRDTVESVDEAVAVLQDLDRNGAWAAVGDGLDALADQDGGYVAALALHAGPAGGTPARSVTISVQVDGDHDALAQITINSSAATYFVASAAADDGTPAIYRVEGDQYVCAQDDEAASLLRDDLREAFSTYGAAAAGLQLFSVTDEVDDDSAVAGRDATHYALESKIPDALEVLEKFDNAELRDRIAEAGQFELTGDLYLDAETGALLRFDSAYHNLDRAAESDLSFEITQWGDVTDLPAPAPEQIAAPCP